MEFNLVDVVIRIGLLLVIALFLTVCTIVVVKSCKIDIKDFRQRTGPKFMSIALAANLLFIYSVYLLINKLDGKDIQTLGISLTPREAVYSVLALFLTFLTALVFVYGLSHIKYYQVRFAIQDFIGTGEWDNFFLSFVVLFVAALQEEVMFRGYLAFVFHNYNIVLAMVLSTIIFTVWHFIGNKVNRYQATDWFIGGLILFFVYVESGSVWVAAFVHFSRNVTNVLVFDIAGRHSLLKWNRTIFPQHKTTYISICSLSIALLTYIAFSK